MARGSNKTSGQKTADRLTKPAPLKSGHKLDAFSCGRSEMDHWLFEHAKKAMEQGTARTFVVCRGTNRVVGYFSLAAGAVERQAAPGALRRNSPDPIPAIILARLAVTESERGSGLGAGLLAEAMKRALQAAQIVGARALIVHALDNRAAHYYEEFGFRRMHVTSDTLYLPMRDIAKNL